MRLYLYVALALAALVLAARSGSRRIPGTDATRPRPPWETRDLVLAGAGFVAAAVLAVVRLQLPDDAAAACGPLFGEKVAAGAEHGMVVLDALVILALPAMAIAWARRDARWAIAAFLVIVVGFGACWEAAGDFMCPPQS